MEEPLAQPRALEAPAPSPRRASCCRCSASGGSKSAELFFRRLWLVTIAASAAGVELHQHIVCHLPADADVDTQPSQCPTVMLVHDMTEFLCKTGLVVLLVKSAGLLVRRVARRWTRSSSNGRKGCFDGLSSGLLPSLLYIAWPGGIWVLYGESGLCGPACVIAESVMEHGCCGVVLLGLAAASFDFLAAFANSGFRSAAACCRSALSCRHGIEDHLDPRHSWQDCGDVEQESPPEDGARREKLSSPKWRAMLEAVLLWLAFLGTASVYSRATWGGQELTPQEEMFFRLLDTLCHAGICAMICDLVVLWLPRAACPSLCTAMDEDPGGGCCQPHAVAAALAAEASAGAAAVDVASAPAAEEALGRP